MIQALALLGYAACAAWLAPALLTPLTSRGLSVRAGLAAWLAAMTSVLVSVVLAVQFSLRTMAADWPRLTQDLCRSVAGQACTPGVYGGLLYQAGVAALAALLTLAAAAALYRYGRRVQRSSSQTRSHARAALLVGRPFGGAGAGKRGFGGAGTGAGARAFWDAVRSVPGARTVVLDDPRPAAYCVAGRPAAIVVTSAALAVLDPAQLSAVLAHERAHLAGRHHTLSTVVRGLAAAFPGVPLFARGTGEVARLAEMSADDAAARSAGRRTVAAALLALATGNAVATGNGGLAAAAHAVPDRVDRLLAPSRPGAGVAAARLVAVAALLLLAPPVLAALAG